MTWSIINILVMILIVIYILILIYGIWEPYVKGTVVDAKIDQICHPSSKFNAEKYWVYIFQFREKRTMVKVESKAFFKSKEKMKYHRGETVKIRYWFSKRNGMTRALIESDSDDKKRTIQYTLCAALAGFWLCYAWYLIIK